MEVVFELAGVRDRLGELGRPVAAARESIVDLSRVRALLQRQTPDQLDFLVRVLRTAVDGDHARDTKLPDDPEMSFHVLGAQHDRGHRACQI